jgi:hypothetical protein
MNLSIENAPRPGLPRIVRPDRTFRANAVCVDRCVWGLIVLMYCNDWIPLTGGENLSDDICYRDFTNR